MKGLHLVGHVRRSKASKNIRPSGEVVISSLSTTEGVVQAELVLRSNIELDDHSFPALMVLNEGLVLVAATGHHETGDLWLYLVKVKPGNLKILKKTRVNLPDPCTYVYLIDDGLDEKLLVTRSTDFNLVGLRVDSQTLKSSEPFKLFPWEVGPHDPFFSGRDGNRPYLVCRPSPIGGSVFALTNDHPRAYRNGVFAGFFRDGMIHDLDGNVVHAIGSKEDWSPFTVLTELLAPGQAFVPWIHDIAQEPGGRVILALSGREKTSDEFLAGQDQTRDGYRYLIGAYDHGLWRELTSLPAGKSLYGDEEDYTGGISLNPLNPLHFVFSSSAIKEEEPTDSGVARWELWEGFVSETGAHLRLLKSPPLGSCVLRPHFSVASPNFDTHFLTYMEGEYRSYKDFDTTINVTNFRENVSCFFDKHSHWDLPYSVTLDSAMPPQESQYLRERLNKSKYYFEYGMGGSTRIAFETAVKQIHSVDTDWALCKALEVEWNSKNTHDSREFAYSFLDLGPIGDWGYPRGDVSPEPARQYAFSFLDASSLDLILIDGRFRAACFLAIVGRVAGPISILWDDYRDRPWYHEIESLVAPDSYCGRMAVFEIEKQVHVPEKFLTRFLRDPR